MGIHTMMSYTLTILLAIALAAEMVSCCSSSSSDSGSSGGSSGSGSSGSSGGGRGDSGSSGGGRGDSGSNGGGSGGGSGSLRGLLAPKVPLPLLQVDHPEPQVLPLLQVHPLLQFPLPQPQSPSNSNPMSFNDYARAEDEQTRTIIYPNYDGTRHVVEVVVEKKVGKNTKIKLAGGVDAQRAAEGEIDPRFSAEINIRGRRSPKSPYLDKENNRRLFAIFDLNEDGKIDVIDWSREGGKLAAFTNLISAHDMDGDEKLSLDEFLKVKVLPDLVLNPDRLVDASDEEGTPGPAQD